MESEEHGLVHHHGVETGTFRGHFGPGCIFIFVGCLWMYNTLFRYHVARRQALLKGNDDRKLKYENSLFSIYHSGWALAVPAEALVMVSAVTVMLIVETASFFISQAHGANKVLHHLLMYFFFGVMGAIKVMQHYKFTVPPSSEYVMFIFANAATAFLLSNHVMGRGIVDIQMHMILVYMNSIQIACVLAEMMYNKSVTAALMRTLMFIAQGIWLCVMASVIHPLPFMHQYDLDDHVVFDVVSSIAVLSIAIALMIAFTMNVILARRVRNMELSSVNFIVAVTQPRRNSSSSKSEVEKVLISDSDQEI